MAANILNKDYSKYEGLLASFYDQDHRWRDYRGQTQLVSSLFPNLKQIRPKLLDLACGSGSHSIVLAEKGFNVCGVDRSRELLRVASEKSRAKNLSLRFVKKDLFQLGSQAKYRVQFDIVVLLGSTLSIRFFYRRFSDLLNLANQLLKEGGFFVFDAVMGKNFNPVVKEPLKYQTKDFQGVLRIKEKWNRTNKTVTYSYLWEILDRLKYVKPVRMEAKETLSILQPNDLFSKIRDSKDQFSIFARLTDYSLDKPYRKGDKNLIVVLKKKCIQ